MQRIVLVIMALVGLLAVAAVSENALARGWGDGIDWVSYEDALVKAKQDNKPIMVVLHKTWCGACKRLRPTFGENKDIERLSKSFVMVNAEDDEEPHSNIAFTIDGAYIPRIYFVSPNGDVLPDVYNRGGSPQYKYYYAHAASIVPSMEEVAKMTF